MIEKIKNIFRATFLLVGIFFVATFLHELYHIIFCKGKYFFIGFGYILDSWILGGKTWCGINGGEGEIIPYIITFSFSSIMIIWFIDNFKINK